MLTSAFEMPVCAGAKGNAKSTKYYTISQKAGTYKKAIKVKVKAKKGYQVFYKTSGKFKKSKVIKSGKSKTFKIRKTTVLSLCAIKKSVKVTNQKLNKLSKQKKKAYTAKYKYTIAGGEASADTADPDTTDKVTPSPDNSTASPTQTTSVPVQTPPSDASDKPEDTPIGTVPPSGGTNPPAPSTATADPEGKVASQEKLNEAEKLSVVAIDKPAVKEPAVIADNTPVITLTADGMTSENVKEDEVSYSQEGNLKTLTIAKAGTYVITGGTVSEPITNTEIIVAGNISQEINLIWDHLVIDNHALGRNAGEDVPVCNIKKSTLDVHVTLKGNSVFTGNGAYTESPAAAVICADDAETRLTFSAYEGDSTAGLTVTDGMDSDTDFGGKDCSDGIYCKGTLVFESGIYAVTVNGDCLKGTGKKGKGGIWINDGMYTLHSARSNALKSKNGNIVIGGGTVRSTYTAGDSINAKNYSVIITGGTIEIEQCYGDGIQAENVNISGDDTVIRIKTYFENAGINYYNSALGSGNYNTMSSTFNSKTEVVNVDTGSHKGIKGGTKACSYRYKSVEDGSDYEAGTVYTKEASGGIVISGGKITIDTTNAGIKYNGGGGMPSGGRPNQGSSGGNLSAANSDGQYIIGAPDDGVHSNNTCVISGGTLKISSSDDGITAPAGVFLMNGCDIVIDKCYEGIEGGQIIIGSSANNTLQMLGGYLNVMVADDTTHSFVLPNADGTETTGNYTSDGDGIDCNGTFYAYGGTIIVYGPDSNGNSAVDTDSGYFISHGVTLLAVGKSGMAESPSGKGQPVVVYGGSSGGFGGMRPGVCGNQGGASSIGAGTAFAIMKDNDVLLAIKPPKNYNYVLYTSPELEAGVSYTLYRGGSVSGSLVHEDDSAYDYRYSGYDASGAEILSTVNAKN